MDLGEQIYLRKSCRKYSDDEIDMDLIHEFSAAKQLNDEIEYSYEILTRDMVNVRTHWSAPYYLAIYSEKRDNYLENVGFVFQQLSLYLQSLGIGSCWVGMASPKSKRSDFIITIAFGKSDDISRDIAQLDRKSVV